MKYTDQEREILNGWPTVTEEDLVRMNDLFPHYLFFQRKGDLMGLGGVKLYTSCCGHKEYRPYLARTETEDHRELLEHLAHKEPWTCPWCGRSVTVIDLAKAKKRKSLRRVELTVLLHARGDALYADALALRKDYSNEAELTTRPTAWCSSGYRFTKGEVMQADYQTAYREHEPVITYERDRLGRQKLVSEPFKDGPIYWYHYEPYSILNREELEDHPFFRYCGFFDHWQYRPGGARGYAAYFDDFISYLTAYAIYPRQVEMLVKSGPWEPLSDLIYSRKKNVAAMCWEETDPRKAFGLNKRELSWFLAVQPPMEVLAIRNYVRKHWGKLWDLPFCVDFRNLWGCQVSAMEVLRFLKKHHLAPGRFLRYLDRISDQTDDRYATLFELYRDYLEAAYALGRCMEHSKVLWPEDLCATHDGATVELAAKQAWEEKNRRASSLKERRLKYEFELDGLKIVFPATGLAIRREGKVLHHCVGGYAERHMNGVTTILFLRRAEAPATPYITLEMDGNQLRQIHGYDNERSACPENPGRVSPRTIHKAFLDTWLRWLRNGSKRNEDGTPKVSRKKKAAGGEPQARTA